MSNFMDFLKNSGSSKTNRIVQESLTRTSGPSEFYGSERKQEKYEKKEKIKNYSHGNSALVTKVGDDYKGYYGHVTDFFPATYELKTEGETYIEADEIIYISKKIITKFFYYWKRLQNFTFEYSWKRENYVKYSIIQKIMCKIIY